MGSSYQGLYVQRSEGGTIYNVQVVDTGGNLMALNPGTYTERGAEPPIEQLPDQKNYDQ